VVEVMIGLLSLAERERRLLRQLPFDETTEQIQQPVSIGPRQLIPATAYRCPQGRGGALGCCSDSVGTMDMAHPLPVEHSHNPAGQPGAGSLRQATSAAQRVLSWGLQVWASRVDC